eukprot:6214206-Pleurochrysis_carterae.AAC.2
MMTHLQLCGALQLDIAPTCDACDGYAAHGCVRMWQICKCACGVGVDATERAACMYLHARHKQQHAHQ